MNKKHTFITKFTQQKQKEHKQQKFATNPRDQPSSCQQQPPLCLLLLPHKHPFACTLCAQRTKLHTVVRWNKQTFAFVQLNALPGAAPRTAKQPSAPTLAAPADRVRCAFPFKRFSNRETLA